MSECPKSGECFVWKVPLSDAPNKAESSSARRVKSVIRDAHRKRLKIGEGHCRESAQRLVGCLVSFREQAFGCAGRLCDDVLELQSGGIHRLRFTGDVRSRR